MSEKTPRQLGEEAEAIYSEYKAVERDLREADDNVDLFTADTQLYHHQLTQAESGKVPFYVDDVESHKAAKLKNRDHAFEFLKGAILKQGELRYASGRNFNKAQAHYHENADGYVDLAILDAEMDGIHINVQQPRETEEHIDVKHG